MTHTEITDAARLIAQLDAYLTPTKPGQYACVVSRRFLVALKRHLETTSEQRLVTTQGEHIGLAVSVESQGKS